MAHDVGIFSIAPKVERLRSGQVPVSEPRLNEAIGGNSTVNDVTTIVITRNRRQRMVQTVHRHAGPVIVVDNGSSDGTVDALRRDHAEVGVIALPRNHGSVARNIGVEAARTPYVAFAEDDSWWPEGVLDSAARLLDQNPTVVLLAASVLTGAESRLDSFAQTLVNSPLSGSPQLPGLPVLGFVSCACVVRRQPFLDAGGFDPVVEFAGEEQRLALDLADAGWALRFVPELTVRHVPRGTPAARRARARRIARNDVLTALMRRPMRVVWARMVRHATAGTDGCVGVAAALWRAPKAVARRKRLSQRVEMRARRLESAS